MHHDHLSSVRFGLSRFTPQSYKINVGLTQKGVAAGHSEVQFCYDNFTVNARVRVMTQRLLLSPSAVYHSATVLCKHRPGASCLSYGDWGVQLVTRYYSVAFSALPSLRVLYAAATEPPGSSLNLLRLLAWQGRGRYSCCAHVTGFCSSPRDRTFFPSTYHLSSTQLKAAAHVLRPASASRPPQPSRISIAHSHQPLHRSLVGTLPCPQVVAPLSDPPPMPITCH